jgi:hypothetical protein
MLRPGGARERGERRESIQRQIHLERSPFGAEAPNACDEIGGECRFFHQMQEGSPGIEIACDDGSQNLFAACQNYSRGSSIFDDDFLGRRIGADHCANR